MSTPEGKATAPKSAPLPRYKDPLAQAPDHGAGGVMIAWVTVLLTIISGVLIHLTDKKNYPGIGDGLWWGIQTVTTVGYGDLVPTSTTGRLIAALVMVVGLGFLTVITAVITSTFDRVRPAPPAGHGHRPRVHEARSIGTRLDAIEATLKNISGHRDDTTAMNRVGYRRSAGREFGLWVAIRVRAPRAWTTARPTTSRPTPTTISTPRSSASKPTWPGADSRSTSEKV